MGPRVLEAATAAKFLARLAVQASGKNALGMAIVDSSCIIHHVVIPLRTSFTAYKLGSKQ